MVVYNVPGRRHHRIWLVSSCLPCGKCNKKAKQIESTKIQTHSKYNKDAAIDRHLQHDTDNNEGCQHSNSSSTMQSINCENTISQNKARALQKESFSCQLASSKLLTLFFSLFPMYLQFSAVFSSSITC